MSVKTIRVTKHPLPMPQARLVQGDANTQVLRFLVKKDYGGTDLTALVWSVWVLGENGEAEVSLIGVGTVSDDDIVLDWEVIPAATKYPGVTQLKLCGSNAGTDEKEYTFVSGYMQVNVAPSEVIDPGYDEDEINEVKQLITDFGTQAAAVKKYTDDSIATEKTYVDDSIATEKTYVDDSIATEKTYVDDKIAAVKSYVDDHTVQDGSLTDAKFTDELKLQTIKDYVTPEMYGAVGDGTTNDTDAIQSAIDYAIDNNVILLLAHNYYCNSTLLISNKGKNKPICVIARNSIIYSSAEIGVEIYDWMYGQSLFDGISVCGTTNNHSGTESSMSVGIQVDYTNHTLMKNISINNFNEKGLYVKSGAEMILNGGYFRNAFDNYATAIYTDTSDGEYTSVVTVNMLRAIYSKGINRFLQFHAWNYMSGLVSKNTIFYEGVGSCIVSDCYIDTCVYGFKVDTPFYIPIINRLNFLWNDKVRNNFPSDTVPKNIYFIYSDNTTYTGTAFNRSVKGVYFGTTNVTVSDLNIYFSNINYEDFTAKNKIAVWGNSNTIYPEYQLWNGNDFSIKNPPMSEKGFLISDAPSSYVSDYVDVTKYSEYYENGRVHVTGIIHNINNSNINGKNLIVFNTKPMAAFTASIYGTGGEYSNQRDNVYCYVGAGGGMMITDNGYTSNESTVYHSYYQFDLSYRLF